MGALVGSETLLPVDRTTGAFWWDLRSWQADSHEHAETSLNEAGKDRKKESLRITGTRKGLFDNLVANCRPAFHAFSKWISVRR